MLTRRLYGAASKQRAVTHVIPPPAQLIPSWGESLELGHTVALPLCPRLTAGAPSTTGTRVGEGKQMNSALGDLL